MKVLHCSAECYPYAKVGGLADVAGSLPKYQCMTGIDACLVMPMHRTKFLYENEWDVVHKDQIQLGQHTLEYTVIKEKKDVCSFALFAIDIYGLLDRDHVYGYEDDAQRYLAFQLAVVNWMDSWEELPEVVHVHDHHTALLPFLMRYTRLSVRLAQTKTVLTIHNAQYQGNMPWEMSALFPAWDSWKTGLLEWNGQINSLACGIKCADRVNTVSKHYMQELRQQANGLELLFEYEKGKCTGIVNGIDYEVWNPEKDAFIEHNFGINNATTEKISNKESLCKRFGLDTSLPLFIFIGRLVNDKGADLIPDVIDNAIALWGNKLNWLMLGSGDSFLEHNLQSVAHRHSKYVKMITAYDEPLSHQMYASADFLLMPSRVEPCGLNQLYALRYGTIPVVRRTGGLQDTVKDIGDQGGFGICFNHASVGDMLHALERAMYLYQQKNRLNELRIQLMKINHSWQQSALEYTELYNSI